jgi:hypothetical protein
MAEHRAAFRALLKRIQRDRNEQLCHRRVDTRRVKLRNQNIISEISTRQTAQRFREMEKLTQKFGLGT